MLLKTVTLLIAALSLAPSFAHVLEAAPRLMRFPPALWRETTVFMGQYQFFGIVGAPLDAAAVIITGVFAFHLRSVRHAFGPALAGAVLFALALIAWATIVAPANAMFATWQPGPLPADFSYFQHRWEIGHMVVAALKFGGLVFMIVAALR